MGGVGGGRGLDGSGRLPRPAVSPSMFSAFLLNPTDLWGLREGASHLTRPGSFCDTGCPNKSPWLWQADILPYHGKGCLETCLGEAVFLSS